MSVGERTRESKMFTFSNSHLLNGNSEAFASLREVYEPIYGSLIENNWKDLSSKCKNVQVIRSVIVNSSKIHTCLDNILSTLMKTGGKEIWLENLRVDVCCSDLPYDDSGCLYMLSVNMRDVAQWSWRSGPSYTDSTVSVSWL